MLEIPWYLTITHYFLSINVLGPERVHGFTDPTIRTAIDHNETGLSKESSRAVPNQIKMKRIST